MNIELRIDERVPFAGGHVFGETGPYERLRGRAHFEADPDDPAVPPIVDLDKAPRNRNGRVEYAADLIILKPREASRASRRLFFGYGNRGNLRELQFFNDAPPSNDPLTLRDAGNSFLMRRGHTIVWAAWQGDILPGGGRLVLDVPVATDNGAPITGLVRSEFIADEAGVTTSPLSGWTTAHSYPTVSLDPRDAQLTRRRYADDPRQPVSAGDWQFARVEGGKGLDNQGAESALIPSATHIHLPGGFDTGWIYELVYTARDPLVLGLGHLVVRDLVSFLRYEHVDSAGNDNPVRDTIDRAYCWGRSQTGRCIRDFIWRGFNADRKARRVMDGAMPHVSGGGLMWMNHRFASPIAPAGQQYEERCNYADHFPFAYAECTDHLTGATDAILKRPDTDPLVLHTQTSTEYWQRHGSLVHTDTQGNDLAPPANARVYLWASSQHFADPNLGRPGRGICQQPVNVVRTSMLFRAMLDALDAWVSDGVPPPESRIPRRGDGTLIDYETWLRQFPAIPGVAIPRAIASLPLFDFGELADAGIFDRQPPGYSPDHGYPTLVPAVDRDGNDIAGVRAPMVQAPLATYTGWNLRARGFGEGAMHEFTGSTLPFADAAEQQAATGDPRRAIADRYGDGAGYVRAIEMAAHELVAQRLMLEEDIERCVEHARQWDRPRHDVDLPDQIVRGFKQ